MAINYAIKYATEIAERFHLKSITEDDCGHGYSFLGPDSKTIRITSVNTVPLGKYKRTGDDRFGVTHDLGDTVQEMTCTQEPCFSFTIDKLDGTDQAITKSAGKALRRELDEEMIPFVDKRRIHQWAMGANIVKAEGLAPTKETIGEMIIDLNAAMTDALVPLDNRTIYISTAYYKLLKLNPDWLGIDSLGKEALAKGVVGEFDGCRVKSIPTSYMPKGVYFFIKYKGCTVDPMKLAQYDILPKVKGYSGPVVQGVAYFDSFVLGAKGDGVAVCGGSDAVLAAPSASGSSGTFTLSCSGSTEIWYTVDGSNPRYSLSKKVYSSSATVAEDETIRVVGVKKDGDDIVAISPMTVKAYE